jgi:hypothetical protein
MIEGRNQLPGSDVLHAIGASPQCLAVDGYELPTGRRRHLPVRMLTKCALQLLLVQTQQKIPDRYPARRLAPSCPEQPVQVGQLLIDKHFHFPQRRGSSQNGHYDRTK